MRRFFILFVFFISLSVVILVSSTGFSGFTAKPLATPSPTPDNEGRLRAEVEQAINEKIADVSEGVLGFMLNNEEVVDVNLSADYSWSSAYLVLKDPNTGEPLPTEPGLTLAIQTASGWQAILPSDPEWLDTLQLAPSDLVSEEMKSTWLTMYERQLALTTIGPLGGYKLPWEAGKTVWLSQSVAHDQYISSGNAHFAFDFYVPQTMFNLYASKAGRVWYARWHVENNSHDGLGNYIVIEDTSTSPTTYQLYLHLAKDSIPEELRERGASVVQGQFIGIADNTGQSSGHHLHFQVHTNPDSYWGTSVDITFQDVNINGGRPRRCDSIYCDRPYCKSSDVCDDFKSSYVSGNQIAGDIVPPKGTILEPDLGVTINSRSVRLEGFAEDEDSGLDKAQFIAWIDGNWQEISREFTTNRFSFEWDMCSDKIADGPVSVALSIWDEEGNAAFGLPGLTHFTKAFTCSPPPTCTPNDNQAALFADINYGGECVTLDIGDYPNGTTLANLGDDQVASIRVGSNIFASLYHDAYFSGRGETFTNNDSNLADNLIGANTTTSVLVRTRTQPPDPVYSLIAPVDETYLFEGESISLSWRDPGGATEFQVKLDAPEDTITSQWLSTPVWHLDTLRLAPGEYTWNVISRNCETRDCLSDQSATINTFNVLPTTITPDPPKSVPFFDDMEGGTNGWTYSGLWNHINDSDIDRVHSLTHSWYYGDDSERNYKDGSPNSGDLTSPRFLLPEINANYLLSFWYRYITESSGTHWDQRWVQISVNGGPFENILQLNDDLPDYWLQSKMDLSAYRGSTIQIRLHFETLDRALNDYEGWYIDDFEIAIDAPLSCKDGNNSPDLATEIHYGQTRNGIICPEGDIDYYYFSGDAGDRNVVDINSENNAPEEIDPVLFLLDSDGTSVLAEHDDEVYGVRRDPHLGYLLSRNGTYYLKVRTWSHPSVGGEDFRYNITLMKDNTPPTGAVIYPKDNTFISSNTIVLSVSATDDKSGIRNVAFQWHSSNWEKDEWVSIGEDWDDEDGWSVEFDVYNLAEQSQMAFYANVYDWAGNWVGIGSWQVGIDRTPPVSALTPTSTIIKSTAIPLSWTSSDNLSGLDYFNIQSASFGSEWVDYSPNPGGAEDQTWYIGEPATIYEFRIRGIDLAGNTESYPANAEVTTMVADLDEICANPDDWETDNSPASANLILVSEPARTHNLCNPETQDHFGDEDWIKLSVSAGHTYKINTTPHQGSSASLTIDLFAEDGTSKLASTSAERLGEQTNLVWTADRNRLVYIRMKHIDEKVIGEDVTYRVTVKSLALYMPFIYKNQSSFNTFESFFPGVNNE